MLLVNWIPRKTYWESHGLVEKGEQAVDGEPSRSLWPMVTMAVRPAERRRGQPAGTGDMRVRVGIKGVR